MSPASRRRAVSGHGPHALLLLLLFLTGNRTSLAQAPPPDSPFVGTYLYHSPWYDVGRKLTLHADGRFSFEWWEGLLGGTTTGAWQRTPKGIVLNSDLQRPAAGKAYHRLLEQGRTPSDSLCFELLDERGETIPFANLVLHHKSQTTRGTTDTSGRWLLKHPPRGNLHISMIGFHHTQIALQPGIYRYKIQLLPGNDRYIYFEQETWRLRGDRLYPPKRHRMAHPHKPYYRKQPMVTELP